MLLKKTLGTFLHVAYLTKQYNLVLAIPHDGTINRETAESVISQTLQDNSQHNTTVCSTLIDTVVPDREEAKLKQKQHAKLSTKLCDYTDDV